MRRLRKTIRWTIGAVLITTCVAIAAVIALAQTRQANEYVRALIVANLTQTYRGQVTIEAIEGSLLGNLEIRNIVVSDNGEAILTVPFARIRYALFPLISGWIRLAEIEVVHPRMKLARAA